MVICMFGLMLLPTFLISFISLYSICSYSLLIPGRRRTGRAYLHIPSHSVFSFLSICIVRSGPFSYRHDQYYIHIFLLLLFPPIHCGSLVTSFLSARLLVLYQAVVSLHGLSLPTPFVYVACCPMPEWLNDQKQPPLEVSCNIHS